MIALIILVCSSFLLTWYDLIYVKDNHYAWLYFSVFIISSIVLITQLI